MKMILIQFKTATEINTSVFVIERSKNLEHWMPIGELPAQGHSTDIQSYQFEDYYAPRGINYYRNSRN